MNNEEEVKAESQERTESETLGVSVSEEVQIKESLK
jgi:hypothetical protein